MNAIVIDTFLTEYMTTGDQLDMISLHGLALYQFEIMFMNCFETYPTLNIYEAASSRLNHR